MTGRANATYRDVVVGQRFGDLSVIGPSVWGAGGPFFPCMCNPCGRPTFVRFARLSAGQQSCGCGEGNRKHDGTKDVLYSVWSNMLSRCRQPRNPAWKHYGGRGIEVVTEWHHYLAFREWAVESGYVPGLQLDRIDNDGPYSPENCRWATRKQQAQNRRSNIRLEMGGETKVLSEWAKDSRCRVKYATLYARVRGGWTLEQALTAPLGTRKEVIAK